MKGSFKLVASSADYVMADGPFYIIFGCFVRLETINAVFDLTYQLN